MNMFKPTDAKTPEEYIQKIEEPRRSQIQQIFSFIKETLPDPKYKPFIIAGMIGFGTYHYKTKSGREGEWAVILLASQKNYISVYACGMKDGKYVAEQYKDELPKANIGKSCIRFKKMEDIEWDVLRKIILESVAFPLAMQ